MIAVDTQILVHAHRTDSSRHAEAGAAMARLVSSGAHWAVPWPCLHEFLAVVTHPRIYAAPTSPADAVRALNDLLADGGGVLIGESAQHLVTLDRLLASGAVKGAKVHDARIAAICLDHGVDTLWTADRDFSYFPSLRTHNPLVASASA